MCSTSSTMSKNVPKQFQDGRRQAQEKPKTGQDRLKTGQNRPKQAQDRSRQAKTGPRQDQDRPKTDQNRPKTAQNRPKPGSRQAKIFMLGPCWPRFRSWALLGHPFRNLLRLWSLFSRSGTLPNRYWSVPDGSGKSVWCLISSFRVSLCFVSFGHSHEKRFARHSHFGPCCNNCWKNALLALTFCFSAPPCSAAVRAQHIRRLPKGCRACQMEATSAQHSLKGLSYIAKA